MPFLGWSVGSGINLVQAVQSGFSGIVITLFYYIVLLPPIYLTETKILKFDGMSTLGMSTIAGLSAAMPMMFVSNNPELLKLLHRQLLKLHLV